MPGSAMTICHPVHDDPWTKERVITGAHLGLTRLVPMADSSGPRPGSHLAHLRHYRRLANQPPIGHSGTRTRSGRSYECDPYSPEIGITFLVETSNALCLWLRRHA
jgi:hypothetical protein